ncbi:MAG: sensor histidine kinase [Halobacterium sp.]
MVEQSSLERRSVTVIGAVLVALAVAAGVLGDDGWMRNAVEVVLPAVMGLCVVGLGEVLRRRAYTRREVQTVAASAAAGGLLFVVIEGWILLIAKPLPGPELVEAVLVFLLNRVAVGVLGAALLAVLYVRIRRQNAELQQLARRLEDRNHSLAAQADKLQTQNQRLNQLAQIVSHDLRNPLNVAMGRAGLARETGDASHYDAVEQALDRMETIVTDMLTLVSQGRLVESEQSIQLGAIAEAAWETVETGDVELDVTTDSYVEADEDRLRHVFENLFRNAVEHGGPGLSTVTVGETPEGFYVADDGAGIQPDDREQLFEPGFSTADDGSGLGTVIAEAIVEAHGWTVEASESDTGGARFDVVTDAASGRE